MCTTKFWAARKAVWATPAAFVAVWALAAANTVFAQPVISNVVVVDSSTTATDRTFNSATRIKISGTGFGEKTRGGTPILWDRVGSYRGIDGKYWYGEGAGDPPYENGSVVSRADTRQPWEEVSYAGLFGKEDNAVYVKGESEELEVKTFGDGVVRRAMDERTSENRGHYVVNGPQGFLGKPREYGGRNPPAGHDYLYVSWWVKQKYNPTRMSNYTLSYDNGVFSPGDNFIVEGTKHSGTILGFPTSGQNYASVVFSSRDAIGAKSLGKKFVKVDAAGNIITGAAAVTATSMAPYTSDGANKFLRAWDNPDGKHFRLSWTATQLAFGVADDSKAKPNTWYTWTGVEEQWNHAELEIDLKNKVLRAWVNNEIFMKESLDNAARDKNFSPTISLMGWDGEYQYYQLTEFGDIYMDNSLQRVVVSNKPTWAEASVAPVSYKGSSVAPRLKEIQYPLKWGNTEIEAEIYVGAYEKCAADGLYIYVSDQSGTFNSNGYKLPGKACPVAPRIL